MSPNEPNEIPQSFDVAFNPKPQKAMDTFSIKAIERDPFLGTLTSRKKASKTSKRNKQLEPEKAMPNITYGGLIQKQGSKSKVFVVNINNQQYLLKQGQTVADVKLIKGNKTAIVIRFNGKNKTINL